MKVLFILNIPSPYRVRFLDLLSEKCDLTVIYDRHTAADRDNDWYVKSEKKYKEMYLKGINYSNDAAVTIGISKYLKKGKYDVIVLGGYATFTQMISIVLLRIRGIPYCLNADGIIATPEKTLKYFVKRFFIQGASRYLSTGKATDDFFANHGAMRGRIKRYHFTSLNKDDILNNLISREEKSSLKCKIGCETSNMILSVGSPIHRKGFDVLLESMENLEIEADLFIVGGEPNAECQDIVNKYNLQHIHFLPFVNGNGLTEYYKAADLFVLPTRYDIWGLVINEALAYGLPVITTNMCNAGLELVSEGDNGYIVPSEDADSLSKAISKALTIDDREKQGRSSLERIKPYNLENMADEHVKIFEEMIQLQER